MRKEFITEEDSKKMHEVLDLAIQLTNLGEDAFVDFYPHVSSMQVGVRPGKWYPRVLERIINEEGYLDGSQGEWMPEEKGIDHAIKVMQEEVKRLKEKKENGEES